MADKKIKIAYLYLLITFCAWGSLYVVSKYVMGKIPVFTVSFLRGIIAGATLFIILRKRNPKKIEYQDYKYVLFIGFAGYFLSSAVQFLGTKLSNASLASLINSMNPITITIFAAIILKEKLTVVKVICIASALSGVFIIAGDVDGSGKALGILASIFSIVLWSFASVIIRQITQKYDSFQITVYGILIGAAFTLPVSVYEIEVASDIQFDWKVILSLFYMGLVCTGLAHVLWNKSLSMLEAGTCSLFYPIQPMVAVLLGWLFLGESINLSFVFGAVLIIGGVVFSLLDANKMYK
ncbi:MAG: EamA family transporter [Gracilibacteraceae bacterium]|nr:EamA family transporter [Gracilibacteraceae bacterium]